MTNNNIIPLVTSNDFVQSNSRVPIVSNLLSTQVIPTIAKKMEVQINEPNKTFGNELKENKYKTKHTFPLKLLINDKEFFEFDYEPIISINSKNIIAKRNVAKGVIRGTVKERWSKDDWEIEISGMLIGLNGAYPSDELTALKKFLEYPLALKCECLPLQSLDIHYLVIEDYSFPFTIGENRQSFEIKAMSDNAMDLFIKI